MAPLIDYVTQKPVVTGGVLALGNFDGVHLGHKAVIETAVKEGKRLGLPVHVLTFEPHPYSLFKKEGGAFLLTSLESKNRLLHEAGADQIVTLSFTPDFAKKTPEAFEQDILFDGCGAKHVVVGFDFVFGCGRGGDRDALRQKLVPMGIGVTEVAPVRDETGEIISSTRIRAFLRRGEVEKASALLGRSFVLEGKVQQGDQRGRTLGFPTANIDMGSLVRPQFGAYAIQARQMGTKVWFNGVANIGTRPSVGGTKDLLEFFLFDFDRCLYGETWEVALLHFLRPEKVFSGLDALKEQIANDAQEAKQRLGART